MNFNPTTHSLHHLHIVAVVDGAVQAATLDSTPWFVWPGADAVYVDPPIPNTVARVYVRNYVIDRHHKIIAGIYR
jgi:hypothetical protein